MQLSGLCKTALTYGMHVHKRTCSVSTRWWVQELDSVPTLGANGVFQTMKMPAQGGEAIILPRWNILALASKPAVLSVPDVAAVPEIAKSFPKPTAGKVQCPLFCCRLVDRFLLCCGRYR